MKTPEKSTVPSASVLPENAGRKSGRPRLLAQQLRLEQRRRLHAAGRRERTPEDP